MSRSYSFLMFVTTLLFACVLNAAQPMPYLPQPTPPDLKAKAYVLQDNTTGKTLVSKDANMRVEPASLTKMMTVYVIDQEMKAGRLSPNDMVTISENAWRTEGSRMFVNVNTQVPVKELLKGVIIQSGNDASVALAEHVAGSEASFAQLMNFYAKQLGMNNTNFVNPDGLPDPNHYTTAEDMAKLARAMINEFPETYKLYSDKTFEYNGIKQNNRNRLLWQDNTVDGIKTGHTDSAGYCLVASSTRDGMRLNAVVIGADSDKDRTEQAKSLLNYGYRFYTTKALLPADQPITTTAVYQGREKQVAGGVLTPLFVTIPEGQQKLITTEVSVNPTLKAPIQRGQTIGSVTVKLNDDVLAQEPVVALETVERGNIWQRFMDWIKLFFKNLFSSSKEAVINTISSTES